MDSGPPHVGSNFTSQLPSKVAMSFRTHRFGKRSFDAAGVTKNDEETLCLRERKPQG